MRRFGEDTSAGPAHGLIETQTDILTWTASPSPEFEVRIRSLLTNQNLLVLNRLKSGELAGTLTFQGLKVVLDRAELRFCGNTSSVSNPPARATKAPWGPSFCRTLAYSLTSGKLVEQIDGPETRTRYDAPPPVGFVPGLAVEPGLAVAAKWSQTSKAGEIVVRDASSGRLRQRLRVPAQSIIVQSPDNRWLIMHAFDQRKLRFYRVSP